MGNFLSHDFFNNVLSKSETGRTLLKSWVFIFRADGHLIYSNAPKEISHSYSALLTGAWHSSYALLEAATNTNEVGRLSFEINDKGITITPIENPELKLFIALIFKGADNPGKMRAMLRILTLELESLLAQQRLNVSNRNLENNIKTDRSGYLFKDISDEEIDRLFHFTGI